MNILITGGAGFIGSHLVAHCLQQGHRVHVVDNLSSGSLENIQPFEKNPYFSFNKADIITWPDLAEKIKWAEVIYHLAAIVGVKHVLKDPTQVINTNLCGCERLFATIKDTRSKPRVMIASSSMVYGENTEPSLKEDSPLIMKSTAQGHWIYAISKMANESIGFAYHHEYQIPITIMRIFNTVGPRQIGRYGMVMPNFIQQACAGKPLFIYGDGTQTRSFCDVRDLVRLMSALAASSKSIGQVVNLGHRDCIMIKDLAAMIKKQAKSQSTLKYISYAEAYGEPIDDIHTRKPELTKLSDFIDVHFDWTLETTVNDLIKSAIEKNT